MFSTVFRTFSTLALMATGLPSQNVPVAMGGGYDFPVPLNIAPGQLLTLFVEGLPTSTRNARAEDGIDLPDSLQGIAAGMVQIYRQAGTFGELRHWRLPIQEVRRFHNCFPQTIECGTPTFAVTVQIPFELENTPDACTGCSVGRPTLGVGEQEGRSGPIEVISLPDNIHFVRFFDSILAATRPVIRGHCSSYTAASTSAPGRWAGLPCPALVYHRDGSLVMWNNPARPGEVLVAHAVGLGRTTPPSLTGKVVTTSASTTNVFGIDFNYRPNALASRPLAKRGAVWEPLEQPLYTGTLEGSVGIYQIRFRVPPVPEGTPACSELNDVAGRVWSEVYSNLTVSVGGRFPSMVSESASR